MQENLKAGLHRRVDIRVAWSSLGIEHFNKSRFDQADILHETGNCPPGKATRIVGELATVIFNRHADRNRSADRQNLSHLFRIDQ